MDNMMITLPKHPADNPSLRIELAWVNNDDDAGTDPSGAINNVRVVVPAPVILENGFES